MINRRLPKPRKMLERNESLCVTNEQPEAVRRNVGDVSDRNAFSRLCGFHPRVSIEVQR
jgi:hypothetical protein